MKPHNRIPSGTAGKVSIVIPNYNGQHYLADCLDSLHRLDFPSENYEIIVVDNASSDNSCDLILSSYPHVLLVRSEKNLGFAGGCNLGIWNSSGEYIVLLNNDTVVDPNWLRELVVVAERDEEVAIVGSKLLFKQNPTVIQNAASYLTTRGDGGDVGACQPDQGQYETTREVMAVCGASMLIKRTLIEEIGALDEDFFAYYEEMDLCYRTRLFGKKIMYAPRSVVYHIHAGTSGEWSPMFRFLVLRNKLLIHIKNSPVAFFLKVLSLYFWQVVREGLVKGMHRKVHTRVLASFVTKLPKFILKRFYVRSILKKKSDGMVLLRLTKVKPKMHATSVKRVCIYNAYLPTRGGGENLTVHMIAYINHMFPSASIDILCHETEAFDESRFASRELIQMLEEDFGHSIKNTALRVVGLDLNRKSSLRSLWHAYKLSLISREYDLFINNTYSSLVPAYAKVNIYSCMFPLSLDRPVVSLMGLFRKLFYKRFLKSYDLFLPISQYTQKWIDEYWNVNSFVLYPPVNTKRPPRSSHKENIIINVGRFFAGGHNKKQHVMVKAFVEMYDKGWTKDWKLILVGRKHTDAQSTAYIRSLEEIAKGYPVELQYDTSVDELHDRLDRAKIYWHATGYEEATHMNPEKFEHFGLSTIEAAQFGAVPVVFNGGGQPEIIHHAKNGFLWNTAEELINFTKLLIENDNTWRELSNAALESMEIFSEKKQERWFKLFLSSYYSFDDKVVGQ